MYKNNFYELSEGERERHNKTRHIECEAAWKKMTAVAKRKGKELPSIFKFIVMIF